MESNNKSKYYKSILITLVGMFLIILLVANYNKNNQVSNTNYNDWKNISENIVINTTESMVNNIISYDIENIPNYEEIKQHEIVINNDIPYFENELTTEDFRIYSDLDGIDKGRAHMAFVNVSKDTMPPEGSEREQLTYNPTGWHQVLYGENNKYHLYERCHLIAWSLGNQNNNPKNLITGTRQMNQAMTSYENGIREWINLQYNENGNKYHVMYRVTPVYDDNNLLAKGVEIEAESVEDTEAIKFNKFIYNVEEGFEINYETGEAKMISDN